MRKKKRKYWYKFHIRECVLCGAGWGSYKERMYSRKPKDGSKRYDYRQFACDSHFL